LSGHTNNAPLQTSASKEAEAERSPTKSPPVWESPLLKKKAQTTQEATKPTASLAEKSNTEEILGSSQNPTTSTNVSSKFEKRFGKYHEKNRRRKEIKKLWKGLQKMVLSNPGSGSTISYVSSASTKRPRESSSTQSTPTSNPKP